MKKFPQPETTHLYKLYPSHKPLNKNLWQEILREDLKKTHKQRNNIVEVKYDKIFNTKTKKQIL